jgi:serine/threonine protein phosphatase PrpC
MEPLAHAALRTPWSSTAATRCGPKHVINEDCFAEMGEAGVFVVADGVGGHTDGGLASRAIIETLSHVVEARASLDARVDASEQALHSVNDALWRESQGRADPTMIASTVAALILAPGYAVCLWAGDSRIYVYREGHLYRLTQDHSADFGVGGRHAGALTRAIGGAQELELDRLVTSAERGDTFLICSDGITKFVEDIELAHFLTDPLDGLATRLVAAVVNRGGSDDATAIVVRYTG